MREHARTLAERAWPSMQRGTRVAFEPFARAVATKRWGATGKGIARGAACGAVWSKVRLEQAGYAVGFDDLFYRLYVSQYPDIVTARTRALEPEAENF